MWWGGYGNNCKILKMRGMFLEELFVHNIFVRASINEYLNWEAIWQMACGGKVFSKRKR